MPASTDRRELAAGEILCKEGDPPDGLFVLLAGEISVWREGAEIGTVGAPGEILGEMALVTGRPRSATLQAKRTSEILHVRKTIRQIERKVPDLYAKLRNTFITRLEMTRAKVKIYDHLFAAARRALLQKILFEDRTARGGRRDEMADRRIRGEIRRSIEQTIEDGVSPNDPRPLEQLAAREGVGLKYHEALKSRYAHLLSLFQRTKEANDLMKLGRSLENREGLLQLAEALEIMTGVLAAYENDPGPKQVLDRMRLEEIIPLNHRIEILKRLYVLRRIKPSERGRSDRERPFWQKIDAAKLDAGSDFAPLYDVAVEWGLGEEYEAELKRAMARAEISSTLSDLSPTAETA